MIDNFDFKIEEIIKKVRSFLCSELFQSSSIYSISSIFQKAIPFLLLPVFTRYLSTTDYGIVAMFTVLVGLTNPFTGLGVKAAVLRSYYKGEGYDFPVYVFNSLCILFVSTAVVFGVFYLFSDVISYYSEFPEDWLYFVVLVSFGQFVINIVLVIWQAKFQALKYGTFNGLFTALNMGISVFLIVNLGYGWQGRIIGQIVAVALFCIVAIYILWSTGFIKFEIVKEYITHALGYGVPLIPHILSGFIITAIDRVFITNMVSVSETGIYTVGYQIGLIIDVLSSSFNKAWSPWLFKQLNKDNLQIKRKIVKLSYLLMIMIVLFAVLLILLAPWIISFFVGKEFYGASRYIIWIAMGSAFNGTYYIVVNYIMYAEKTYLLSWITFITAGINILMNYFFIKANGAIGAAQATTASYLFLFLFVWISASIIYPMPWFSVFKKNL